ncbi:MAG TPA: hypothetical protein VEB59_07500 [Gemmatimonadales bacterium]|nr:hypothetical protein [Gemmatimonadales bacterium]
MAAVNIDADPAVPVTAGSGTRQQVAVHNAGPATVYLGGADVTAATGYPLAAGEHLGAELGEAQTLYGICDTGQTAELRTLTL